MRSTDDDLDAIGAAAATCALVTGGSGIALGLPQNFRNTGLLPRRRRGGACRPSTARPRSCGPLLGRDEGAGRALAATRPRFRARSAGASPKPRRWPTPRSLALERLLAAAPVLIYATATPQGRRGAARRSAASARLRASRTRWRASRRGLVDAGVRRLVVAGGETSGAVVKALGVATLRIGAQIDPGVPWTEARAVASALALALKSGNFGSVRLLREGARAARLRKRASLDTPHDAPRLTRRAPMSRRPLREELCPLGRSLFERGLTHGSTGNLSVRIDAGWLTTPTGTSLGRARPGPPVAARCRGASSSAATRRRRSSSSSRDVPRARRGERDSSTCTRRIRSRCRCWPRSIRPGRAAAADRVLRDADRRAAVVPYFPPAIARSPTPSPPARRAITRCCSRITVPSSPERRSPRRGMRSRSLKRRRSSCCCWAAEVRPLTPEQVAQLRDRFLRPVAGTRWRSSSSIPTIHPLDVDALLRAAIVADARSREPARLPLVRCRRRPG